MSDAMPKHRLCPGQRSLLEPDEAPVAYCGLCGHRLRGVVSIERGFGPTCFRVQVGRLQRRRHCASCGRRVTDDDVGCDHCGNGYDTKSFRTKVRYHKPKATS